MKKVYLLYFDIVNSRLIKNRRKIESKIGKAINYVQLLSKQNPAQLNKMEVWKGLDELMYICETPQNALQTILELQHIFSPYAFRVIIAETTLKKTSEHIREMNDSAFAKITDAMVQLKKKPSFLDFLASDDEQKNALLFLNLQTILLLKSNFTEKQMQLYGLYSKGFTQNEMALKLKVSQQYISSVLRQIRFAEIHFIERKLLLSANGN